MPHPLPDSPLPDPEEVVDLEDATEGDGDAILLESTMDAPDGQDGDADSFGVQD